ncbi:RNA polymerase sigma factor SigM [Streptomyces sp. B3I7]|uniref:RNA polymerase sigma factor SigM n=1 Tax=Streptomyces sp. B3I7 TaxID=3042269 RepID=UPI0027D77CF5|nr:RNA polymerase sigma factor SigM [Streptomyces sp. B3I7]
MRSTRTREGVGWRRTRTYGGLSDQDLLSRHVEGDHEAFGELVRRHRDRLWAVALRTLGDREEAADAVQDALVSAYRAAHTFRGRSAVTTWLHRITVNACLDRARKVASRRTSPVEDSERLEQLLEPHESASAPAERNEVNRELLQALATLQADQRAALVLVDMQGYSVAEAARILDVPTGTVKSRCARGRARLLPLLTHLRSDGGGNEAARADDDGTRAGAPKKSAAAGRNRTRGTSVPPAAKPRDAGPSDSAAVRNGGGQA